MIRLTSLGRVEAVLWGDLLDLRRQAGARQDAVVCVYPLHRVPERDLLLVVCRVKQPTWTSNQQPVTYLFCYNSTRLFKNSFLYTVKLYRLKL